MRRSVLNAPRPPSCDERAAINARSIIISAQKVRDSAPMSAEKARVELIEADAARKSNVPCVALHLDLFLRQVIQRLQSASRIYYRVNAKLRVSSERAANLKFHR